MPSAADEPLVFLHVPKTAGTTLWLILRRQYSPQAVLRIDRSADLAAVPQQQWDHTRVLLGHLSYGLHGFQRQPTYLTILRDPLERTLSHYSHWARDNDHSLTLEEYLDAGILGTDNNQTRMLAGPEAAEVPPGQCGRDVFEEAKRHLTDEIVVTGLTERFDETLILLQRRLGWDMPCYVAENVGANRLNRDQVPRDVLRRIWDMTQWDRELYALAAMRLVERIASEGPSFKDSLRRFRIANTRYRRMKALVAAGPLHALKRGLDLERQMRLEAIVRSLLNVAQWRGAGQAPEAPAKPNVSVSASR